MKAAARLAILLAAAALALPAQPKRIVSTSPSITETLFALGLGDRVVGVSQHCHYPPPVDRLPRVGSYFRPNVEAVLALRPDLVIVQSKGAEAAGQLQRVKLPILNVEPGGLEEMFAGIRALGDRCGVRGRAAQLERDIRTRLDAIRQRTAGLPRRSLVFVVGRSPGALDNLTAVGRGSFLNELIEIAGGTNALAATPMPYPAVSLESILAVNPDVLVDMGEMAETVGVSEQRKRAVVALWSRHTALRAVAQKRVYAVASDVFVVPGPRVVQAAEVFERMLHPEVRR